MIGTANASRAISTEAVLDSIRKAVFRGRVRLHEFFADFDPLRSGLITEAKFRTALDASGLRLNDPEMANLTLHYAEDPSVEQKRVRYKELLADVDVVFNTTGMEVNPYATSTDFTPQVAPTPRTLSPRRASARRHGPSSVPACLTRCRRSLARSASRAACGGRADAEPGGGGSLHQPPRQALPPGQGPPAAHPARLRRLPAQRQLAHPGAARPHGTVVGRAGGRRGHPSRRRRRGSPSIMPFHWSGPSVVAACHTSVRVCAAVPCRRSTR